MVELSPRKPKAVFQALPRSPSPPSSPTRRSSNLLGLAHCNLKAQKIAMLRSLRAPPLPKDDGIDVNAQSKKGLNSLLRGTFERGEGNSCFIVGAKGSGKTRMVEDAIAALDGNPIVVRLSGWVQRSDRDAMREVAVQVRAEVGERAFLSGVNLDGEEESAESADVRHHLFIEVSLELTMPIKSMSLGAIPHSSLLPLFFSTLPTLPRPVIIIIDAIDVFARLSPRQALLYCLLDTVQNTRGTKGSQGFAVIGVTRDVRIVEEGLEKRVKSRFSGRVFNVVGASGTPTYSDAVLDTLKESCLAKADSVDDVWNQAWEEHVNKFFASNEVKQAVKEVVGVGRDWRVLQRVMMSFVLALTAEDPTLNLERLKSAVKTQRVRPDFPFVKDLPYAHLLVLIASYHRQTQGHEQFNFEMIWESVRDQVKASSAAPVTLAGATTQGIGMKKAFEHLVAMRMFMPIGSERAGTQKEFIKYRSVISRGYLKEAIKGSGETELKKWISRAAEAK
ncbi:origin recognition complex subunit 4 C-terminus-domain-containing protein [Flagelloscypha sp. PMI_526]|nr:origin recognition complex subunit 4 C-terminus-domain-containing protein [Flagelloscypha sp. PMI_526]